MSLECFADVAACHAADEEWGTGSALPDEGVLLPEGHLVAKLLEGEGSEDLVRELRMHFKKVYWMQPKATRSESREMFIVAMKRKQV